MVYAARYACVEYVSEPLAGQLRGQRASSHGCQRSGRGVVTPLSLSSVAPIEIA
jgi:hypothetical protein